MVAIVLMLSMWPKGTSVLVRISSFASIRFSPIILLIKSMLNPNKAEPRNLQVSAFGCWDFGVAGFLA